MEIDGERGVANVAVASVVRPYAGAMSAPCIVGIDCATVAERVGLALAVPEGDGWRLEVVTTGSAASPPAALVGAWLRERPNALLALDAPLGWPAALGDALATHRAGAPIPLTWRPDALPRADVSTERPRASPQAIEVYPAATLRAHGAAERGYTQPGSEARTRVATFVRGRLRVAAELPLEPLPADAFDAVLCVIAGIDAARGEATPPDDEALARREGWIWVRAARIDCVDGATTPARRHRGGAAGRPCALPARTPAPRRRRTAPRSTP